MRWFIKSWAVAPLFISIIKEISWRWFYSKRLLVYIWRIRSLWLIVFNVSPVNWFIPEIIFPFFIVISHSFFFLRILYSNSFHARSKCRWCGLTVRSLKISIWFIMIRLFATTSYFALLLLRRDTLLLFLIWLKSKRCP